MAINPDKLVHPEDEIFWRQVREAYHRVSTKREQAVTLELAGKRADVEAGSEIIIIMISEVEPTKTPLIVPPGSHIPDDL